jgi:beta-lactam-binding protein with PASTA domain
MSFKTKVVNFFKGIWLFLSTPFVYKNLGLMLGVFLVFLFLVFYLILPGYTRHGEEVKIIEVKNLTVEQAKKTLNALRLNMVVADSTYVPNKTLGVIVDQSPAAGSIVKPKRTIYVTVNSSQPPKVSIYYSQIITQHLDQVSRMLKSMDIKIGKLKYIPGKGENTIRSISMKGRLVFKEADPRKGEKKPDEPQFIPRGSTVDLELYKGEDAEPKEVPNLLCSTYEEAMLLILGNEFYIGTIYVAASAKKDTLGAYIVKQSPRPGTVASMGTGIDIWLERKRPEECE